MTTVYGDITPTQAAYSSKETLKRALPYLVLEQFGQLKTLPANNTKTIDFRRHKLAEGTNIDAHGVAKNASGFAVAVEGVTPPSVATTMDSVTVTLVQYIAITEWSDVIEDTHIDNVLTEYMGALGEIAGQIVEFIRWEGIRTGTTFVYLAGAVASESLIIAPFSKAELRAAIRTLRANHAKQITNVVKSDVRYGTKSIEPAFAGVVHSDMEGTIRKVLGSDFTPVADYGSGASVLDGEFGKFENVRFVSSDLIGKRANAGAAVGTAPNLYSDNGVTVNLYDIILMGGMAWGSIALKGEHAVTPMLVKAKPSDSDPAAQRNKASIKMMQAAKVLQPAHLVKIVSGSYSDAQLG